MNSTSDGEVLYYKIIHSNTNQLTDVSINEKIISLFVSCSLSEIIEDTSTPVSITYIIRHRILLGFGHVCRVPRDNVVTGAYKHDFKGPREIGGQLKRCGDQIRNDTGFSLLTAGQCVVNIAGRRGATSRRTARGATSRRTARGATSRRTARGATSRRTAKGATSHRTARGATSRRTAKGATSRKATSHRTVRGATSI